MTCQSKDCVAQKVSQVIFTRAKQLTGVLVYFIEKRSSLLQQPDPSDGFFIGC